MDEMIKHIDLWQGNYHGVPFEIRRWDDAFRSEPCWTFYIIVRKEMFSDDVWEDICPIKKKVDFWRGWMYDTDENPLAQLPFHGGCTFFERICEDEVYKIGCDYLHYYDEGMHYELDDIVPDVKKVIDALCARYID